MSNIHNEVVLEAKNIVKIFETYGGKQLVANNDVSFEIYKGEIFGIVGESGCGKSTLARILLSLEKSTSGQIIIDGINITTLSGERLRQSKRKIQMVFQDPTESLNPKMKIKNIICEPLRNFNCIKNSEVHAKTVELLEMVELSADFADRYPHSMNGGQRQRVGIARALALSPKVIVLDEATSALDVSVQKNIIDLVLKLQKEQGITFIFICHDIALVRAIADRIIVMYKGKIVETLSKEKVKKSDLQPYTQQLFDSVFYVQG